MSTKFCKLFYNNFPKSWACEKIQEIRELGKIVLSPKLVLLEYGLFYFVSFCYKM